VKARPGPGAGAGARFVPRVARTLVVLLVGLGAVSGCGEDPIDSYCSDLGAHRKQIADMLDSTSPDALFARLDVMKDLAHKAPPDLQDEWQTFLDAVQGLDRALKDAGVKPSDFVGGRPPAGLSAADRTAIIEAADQLSSDDVVQAASGIEQEARDVCKINLGL
jgi:hypothetical protein